MRRIANPRNPFESQHRELLEPSPQVSLEVYDDVTREILSRNESPDLPFRWSVNPYRGCFMRARIVTRDPPMNTGDSAQAPTSTRKLW